MTLEECWATGLFEGEGCIYIHPKKNSTTLIVRSTDLDVLERIERLWGGNIKPFKQSKSEAIKSRKQCYQWRIYNGKDIKRILETMLPFLGERRALKALDALDRIDKC